MHILHQLQKDITKLILKIIFKSYNAMESKFLKKIKKKCKNEQTMLLHNSEQMPHKGGEHAFASFGICLLECYKRKWGKIFLFVCPCLCTYVYIYLCKMV